MDWNSEYLAASNQLAAWEGWGAKESIMCPETADGNASSLYNIEHALTSVAHEPSTMAAGNPAELSESTNELQLLVNMIICPLLRLEAVINSTFYFLHEYKP